MNVVCEVNVTENSHLAWAGRVLRGFLPNVLKEEVADGSNSRLHAVLC